MKCPKCQYISFDSGDRCRNCGYEFSLALDVPPVDLPIQTATSRSVRSPTSRSNATPNLPLCTPCGDPDAPLVRPAPRRARRWPITALRPAALRRRRGDDAPLVAAAAPRAPLAVRRSASGAARSRSTTADELPRSCPERRAAPAPSPKRRCADRRAVTPRRSRRAGAAPARRPSIDVVILWPRSISLVVYFTLQSAT